MIKFAGRSEQSNSTMRKLLLIVIAAIGISQFASAQRFAFVDTRYILENMPEYSSAQQELDRISEGYQSEIQERYEMIANMKDAYKAEEILLSEEMRQQRLQEIERREEEAKQLQKKRFGVKGDLFSKRQELIQPIQDRVYQAIKEVAGTSYVAVFDISGNSNLLFANEKYDKSDSVLRKLGIRPGENQGNNNSGGTDNKAGNNNDQRDKGGSNGRDGGSTNPVPKR